MGRQKCTAPATKATCLCAPTSHAGSFRCRLHRTSRKLSPTLQPSSQLPYPQSEEASSVIERVSLKDANDLKEEVVMLTPEPTSSKESGALKWKPSRLRKVVFAAGDAEESDMNQQSLQHPEISNVPETLESDHNTKEADTTSLDKFES
ncbi:hypothetical protein O6H91_16G045400 [Diphasiastrum complanatum]|uniref:Uncharacterized protein n=1 Tax=Diphasiastrum complanatum TaxID=34168 RepID=A0ACC2BBV7_DIPCM|nr:hypothetical protein O6H91_16G045400 [Diphasiastrum complanatum]